jgi:3-oxoacyl-[acyl-carrier protein] reductase
MTEVDNSGSRVALVTGAAGGLGAAFCAGLAAAGYRVAGLDVADQAGTAGRVTDAGGQFCAVRADLAEPASLVPAVAEVTDRFGRLDVVVNNAGLQTLRSLEDTTPEVWDRIMAVNLRGMFFMTQAALPWLRRSGDGRVVNIASAVAFLGPPGTIAYSMSKAGAIGFTRALASELGDENITVNAIAPSMIATEGAVRMGVTEGHDHVISQQAIHRAEQPEDLVSTLLYLCAPASRFVTGTTISVDGGHAKH